MNALPYKQPVQETLLPLSSFLLALHIAAWPLEKVFSCGLISQIVIGILWGPVTSWLALDVQRTIVQLGYIGLILLVYQGCLFVFFIQVYDRWTSN
jgi:Kef-type K+ transport system membrane component KefB